MAKVLVIVAPPEPVGMIFDQPRARLLASGRMHMAVRPVERTGGEPLHLLEHGSRVWVREAFRVVSEGLSTFTIAYRAGGATRRVPLGDDRSLAPTSTWRSSAAMPRWASRTVLTVDRVERQRLLPLRGTRWFGLDQDLAVECGFASVADFTNAWDARYRRHGLLHGSNPEVYALWFSAKLLPDWETP